MYIRNSRLGAVRGQESVNVRRQNRGGHPESSAQPAHRLLEQEQKQTDGFQQHLRPLPQFVRVGIQQSLLANLENDQR